MFNCLKNIERLEHLKYEKFLIYKLWRRVSENLHIEIFKYLNCSDLLQIRVTNLGGYQLAANKYLRPRIKNYFPSIQFYPNPSIKILEVIFEQTGQQELNLEYSKEYLFRMKITHSKLQEFSNLFEFLPQLKIINLCTRQFIY